MNATQALEPIISSAMRRTRRQTTITRRLKIALRHNCLLMITGGGRTPGLFILPRQINSVLLLGVRVAKHEHSPPPAQMWAGPRRIVVVILVVKSEKEKKPVRLTQKRWTDPKASPHRLQWRNSMAPPWIAKIRTCTGRSLLTQCTLLSFRGQIKRVYSMLGII